MAGGQAVTSGQGSVKEGSSVPLKSRKAGTGSGTQAISGLAAFSSSGLFSPAPVSTPTGQVAALFQGSFGKQRATLLAGQASSVAPGSAGIAGSGAFALPTIAGALTWNTPDTLAAYPSTIAVIAANGGTKHTRWEWRTVDQCWYVLGGDISGTTNPPAGEASSILWKVDTRTRPFTFTKLIDEVAPTGHKYPSHVDEAPWMYDSKRDRFLLYPNPRWPIADNSDCIVGHLMSYDPTTNLWTDLGSGTYTGNTGSFDKTNNPQFDINGHQYPIDFTINKWGFYDEATDKYYIPGYASSLMVLNASDYSIAEWPIATYGDTGGEPYPLYNASFHTACLCVDRLRRRFVSIRPSYDYIDFQGTAAGGTYYPSIGADPNGMKLWTLPIDTTAGVRTPSYLSPQTNQVIDPANPFYIDFEALYHDEANDLYVVYGGSYKKLGDQNHFVATNDFRAIPASGGTWTQYLPTDTRPVESHGLSMHHDPKQGTFQMGGIGGEMPTSTADQPNPGPNMFFPRINAAALSLRPSWRAAMSANTWVALGSNTLASLDPMNDASINPNGAGNLPPWMVLGGGAQGAIVTAWNGATYDDLNHAMHLDACGGHGDYGGNESYRIDLSAATPAWTMPRKPTGAIGNTGTVDDGNEGTGIYFDGRPRSTHTYNGQVFVPSLGGVMPGMVAPFRFSGNSMKAWKFDPTTGAPSLLANFIGTSGLPAAGAAPTIASAYDPVRRCVWTIYSGTSKIQKLNCVTNAITTHGASANWGGAMNWIGYLPEVDALLVISTKGGPDADTGATGLTIINLSTFVATGLAMTGSFATGFNFVQANLGDTYYVCGAAWDATRHRLMLWQNASNTTQISTLTPPSNYFTGTWTRGTLTPAGGATPTVGAVNGTYGRFAFSPSYDGAFLLNNVADPVYFYALS